MKDDLKRLVDNFHRGVLDTQRLNYGVITLSPKCKNVIQIQKLHPICLLNESFKIITKILMNKLSGVVDSIVSRTQTTFIKNIYIVEGVLLLHETLNTIHKKKKYGILFKVDFEKAYDKIKWLFFCIK